MTVVVPAGLSLLEAARWVGESCWLELNAYELLTATLLDSEIGATGRVAVWTVRAHRGEMAEAWNRRLPELAEHARSSFVAAPPDVDLSQGSPHQEPPMHFEEVIDLLEGLDQRYASHQGVAVGTADGPVSETLDVARRRLTGDVAQLAPLVAPTL